MTDWNRFTFEDNPAIKVGISSCLLGEEVRYNGGHAHDSFLTTVLGEYFDWIHTPAYRAKIGYRLYGDNAGLFCEENRGIGRSASPWLHPEEKFSLLRYGAGKGV